MRIWFPIQNFDETNTECSKQAFNKLIIGRQVKISSRLLCTARSLNISSKKKLASIWNKNVIYWMLMFQHTGSEFIYHTFTVFTPDIIWICAQLSFCRTIHCVFAVCHPYRCWSDIPHDQPLLILWNLYRSRADLKTFSKKLKEQTCTLSPHSSVIYSTCNS